jgi:hypothetical protein
MKTKRTLALVAAAVGFTITFAGGLAVSAQDKYALKVPGGLAFSEFKGYESWEVVSISYNNGALAATLANPVMIQAFKAGIPENGQPFPDGAKMAKVHWIPKKSSLFPSALVPDKQHDVDFMVKDSKRFGDVGGWGYAEFMYDAAADTFRPGNESDNAPQGHDAKCGVSCHNIAKGRNYVFTEYGHR